MFPLIAAGLGLLGGYQAQRKLGEAQDRMSSAAERAAREGKYKPFGVTSGAGTASFKDGQASYSMDPRYRAQQEQMFGLGTAALDRAGGSYDDMASDMYNRQRNLGAGGRLAEATQLGNSMFGAGTGGLRVSGEALGGEAGSGMLSPDGYGFARAFAQQDAIDRSNAFEQAQRQREREIAIGTGMFSQGQAMDDNSLAMIGLGGDLGSQQSAANNNAMQNYLSGQSDAANYQARRGQSMAGTLTNFGTQLGKIGGGGQLPTVPTSQYMATPTGQNRMSSYSSMGSGGMYPTYGSGGPSIGATTYGQYGRTPIGQNRIGSYNAMSSPLGQWSPSGGSTAASSPVNNRYPNNMYTNYR
jgi:hypothetical protein